MIQWYPLDSEGIPECINDLKDAQAKAERANNLINDATLVIIATNDMLSTEKLPRSNEYREDLDVAQRTWTRCETTYRTASKDAEIKNKSAGV